MTKPQQKPPDREPDRAPQRLPPQDLVAEKALLGSLLLENDALDDVLLVLKPEDFYLDSHRKIYEAILALVKDGKRSFDPVTIADKLDKVNQFAEAGGEDALTEILESVPHGAHAKHYAEIVREKAGLRGVIFAATDAIRGAFENIADAEELAIGVADRMTRLLERAIQNARVVIGDLIADCLRRISSKEDPGISCGFAELDQLTNGLQPANLVILAARTSMGKTSFFANIALAAAKRGDPVLLFSLEQSKLELAERLISTESGIAANLMRKASSLSENQCDQIMQAAGRIETLPLWIDDGQSPKVAAIEASCRIQKRRGGLKLVMIDYLQLIEPEDRRIPREQQIAVITRRLKFLARNIEVPVVVLAQVNRQNESRDDKRPRLSDLRESGAIENDADIVLFIHRPEYYDTDDQPGIAEIIVSKHRNGPLGTVKLKFSKPTMTFHELTAEEKWDPQKSMPFSDDPHVDDGGFR